MDQVHEIRNNTDVRPIDRDETQILLKKDQIQDIKFCEDGPHSDLIPERPMIKKEEGKINKNILLQLLQI